MKILVMNCGSSSIKYSLFDMDQEKKLGSGKIERMGTKDATIHHQRHNGKPYTQSGAAISYEEGIETVVKLLVDEDYGWVRQLNEIDAVGHRVVHGGDRFFQSTLIHDQVIDEIEKLIPFAPLHNPANIAGIRWIKKHFPDIEQVAVFDTAYHQTMPRYAYSYGLPQRYLQAYRRYGFHGISHRYVAMRAAKFLKKASSVRKMITCHIGNGVSITAIDQGVSIDTSMGLTPLEGVMMGTRSGSIDPSLIPFLMRKTNKTVDDVLHTLNHESGLLGVSGISQDLREILEAMSEGNPDAQLAIEMYTYQIKKMIGSFLPVLGGLDVLVFTAGVGENVPLIREKICDGFRFLGMELHTEKNELVSSSERRISTPTSQVDVLVIPTNEELMIALETKTLVEEKRPC